uniref:2-oxo-4-hydroxy-4-carboxy-5-ureidoimidazoline decarboxylase n=1 Tax=Photinus pyralis TaxID=7054 RepID=A0A1Y1NFW0_PHOPY
MDPVFTNIDEVNRLPSEQFIKIFGNVVEHHPAAAIQILKNRPFRDAGSISHAVNNYLDSLSEHEVRNILQYIPELAGKLADLGKMSLESTYEQSSAGLLAIPPDTKQKLSFMNEQYRIKFGFPYIICVREKNSLGEILDDIQARLKNGGEEELSSALEEVKKICRLRILTLIKQ